MSVRYGVTIEFTVASAADGGPNKADIRRWLRRAVESLREPDEDPCYSSRFDSLRNVGIKYLHEATTTKETQK